MVSFCTPYTKDRLYQLEMTTPENLALCGEYGCEWVRLLWEDEWNYSKAWNKVHSMAKGDIQVTFGADCYLSREYIDDIIEKFKIDMNILVTASNGGVIAVSADNFKRLGGFDETMSGWGFDDIDFIYRAQTLGLTCHLQAGMDFLPHSDHLRFPDGDRKKHQYQNWVIMRYNYDNKIIDWRTKDWRDK